MPCTRLTCEPNANHTGLSSSSKVYTGILTHTSQSPTVMNRLVLFRAFRPALAAPSIARSTLPLARYQRARPLSTRSEPAAIPSAIPPAALPRRLADLHTTVSHFSQVRGVGRATAHAWAQAGCQSLDDVLARDTAKGDDLHLTDYQRVNLYEWIDYLSRVPVSELGELERRLEGLVRRTDEELEGGVVAVASGGGFSSYRVYVATTARVPHDARTHQY